MIINSSTRLALPSIVFIITLSVISTCFSFNAKAQTDKEKSNDFANDLILEGIRNETDSIINADLVIKYRYEGLEATSNLINMWVGMYNKSMTIKTEEASELNSRFSTHLKVLQVKEFPRLRKEQAKMLTMELSYLGLDVSLSGEKNDTLKISSKSIKKENSLKDIMNDYSDIWTFLRFKSVVLFSDVEELNFSSELEDESLLILK